MNRNLWGIQNTLLEKDLVTKVEVESITPILMGGYDGKVYHDNLGILEDIRSSSIKGVIRWWLRALIAAALYKLHKKYADLKTIDKIVEYILGSSESEIGCSKYAFVIESNGETLRNNEFENLQSTLPQLKLLRGYRDRPPKPGLKFIIKLYRQRCSSKTEDELMAYVLVLGLIFDGIGKRSSRGLGKVKVLSIEPNVDDISNRIHKLYNTNDPQNLEKELEELIKNGVKKAEDYLRSTKEIQEEIKRLPRRPHEPSNLPSIELPLIEEDKQFIVIKIPNTTFNNPPEALRCIGNTVLKLYHKALKIEKSGKLKWSEALNMAKKISGQDIHTWILGLPRAQEPPLIENHSNIKEVKKKLNERLSSLYRNSSKIDKLLLDKFKGEILNLIKVVKVRKKNKIRIPTGYYCIDEDIKLRRKSPVRFTLMPTSKGLYIVIYGFKTGDWEKLMGRIVHIGAYVHKSRSSVRLKDISLRLIDTNINDISKLIDETINAIVELIENHKCLTGRK